MQKKDTRVHLMGELLNGIKVLKLYAWELPFQNQILSNRQKELKDIKNINYINAFGAICWLLTPYLVGIFNINYLYILKSLLFHT